MKDVSDYFYEDSISKTLNRIDTSLNSYKWNFNSSFDYENTSYNVLGAETVDIIAFAINSSISSSNKKTISDILSDLLNKNMSEV